MIAVAGACDVLRAGTGLIAAIIMGLALANRPGFDIPARLPFLEMPIQLTIDVLLVSVAATVAPHVAVAAAAAHPGPGRRAGADRPARRGHGVHPAGPA